MKDPDTAAREFREVLTLDPRNVEAHTNLGLISFLHGDCNAASDEWRKALAVQPTLYKAHALLGICKERMGNHAARGMLEKAFAKLKALLRKEAARTIEALCSAIGRIIDLITPAECLNMFASAGYDPD